MTNCLHISCGREKKVWLPVRDHSGADVNLHPWCVHCGVVKNISDDRARNLGYWMNILSKISRRFSFKQVQKRCIAKELASHEWFNDTYSITGYSQKELFKNIVAKYCNINVNTIESFFY
ncbi:MAG: hypothetical protein ACOC5T_05115 [Elusimicrobiota bacterium]